MNKRANVKPSGGGRYSGCDRVMVVALVFANIGRMMLLLLSLVVVMVTVLAAVVAVGACGGACGVGGCWG